MVLFLLVVLKMEQFIFLKSPRQNSFIPCLVLVFDLGHSMAVRSLAFSPDSRSLITASDDKRINVYDV